MCGKTFSFQQSYHKHMLYHTDEKPHCCIGSMPCVGRFKLAADPDHQAADFRAVVLCCRCHEMFANRLQSTSWQSHRVAGTLPDLVQPAWVILSGTRSAGNNSDRQFTANRTQMQVSSCRSGKSSNSTSGTRTRNLNRRVSAESSRPPDFCRCPDHRTTS